MAAETPALVEQPHADRPRREEEHDPRRDLGRAHHAELLVRPGEENEHRGGPPDVPEGTRQTPKRRRETRRPFVQRPERARQAPDASQQDEGEDDAGPPDRPRQARGEVHATVLHIAQAEEDHHRHQHEQRGLQRELKAGRREQPAKPRDLEEIERSGRRADPCAKPDRVEPEERDAGDQGQEAPYRRAHSRRLLHLDRKIHNERRRVAAPRGLDEDHVDLVGSALLRCHA